MGKSIFFFLACLGALFVKPVMAGTNSYTLEDALKKKLVTAVITGRNDATTSYYGDCITLKLKNTTNQTLSINLETGRRLNCVYDSIQDMLVTQAQIFALLPTQTKEYTIYAMCCQQHDHSPKGTSVFNLGSMAESQLVQLSLLIEKLNAQNYTGQRAVWVLTDDANPNDVTGDDETVASTLREFVINVVKNKKQTVREPGFIYDYSYPTTDGKVFTIEGDFEWEMPYQNFVSLFVYDNSGNRLFPVFQDVAFSSGLQIYHYKVANEAFKSGELYWLRLKFDSKTIKEVAVSMD
jgi:hypothetical protein